MSLLVVGKDPLYLNTNINNIVSITFALKCFTTHSLLECFF